MDLLQKTRIYYFKTTQHGFNGGSSREIFSDHNYDKFEKLSQILLVPSKNLESENMNGTKLVNINFGC